MKNLKMEGEGLEKSWRESGDILGESGWEILTYLLSHTVANESWKADIVLIFSCWSIDHDNGLILTKTKKVREGKICM